MEQTPRLDDIALFLAVADADGLAGAARATNVPQPTLSRRMAELERRLSLRLFERGPRGYSLTAQGRALLAEAEPLREAAQRLHRFADRASTPHVRITAGHWTARFIAAQLGDIWTRDAPWVPQLLASNMRVDISRREADIGIRNARPDQSWLAGRRTAHITYAPFAASARVSGYVTLPESSASTPSERWLRRTHPDDIVTTASDARLAAEMARGGVGRVILPVFAGRALAGLEQVAPEIDEIAHDEWLVCHHDARHDPPIRAAIEAIAGLLSDPARRNGA